MTKMDYNKTELYYLQSRYYNPKSVNPIGNLSRSFLARLYRILCSSQTRTGGERLGSEGSAALWQKNGGPHKACFVGRGKAKIRVEFPACRKCNIVSCALTKRVAAVGVQRSRTVGKAHTASPQQDTGTKKQKHIHRPGQWMCFLYASFSPSSGMRLSNHRFLPWRCEQSHRC